MGSADSIEKSRLEVLKSFHILDTPSEAIFDRLTQLAARICETPIAAITLIDEQRQWFKSAVGLSVSETSRDISFCTHTILGKKALVVEDAKTDPRFRDNPLVVGPPGLAFYAGVPLITASGFALGSLAVMDHVPRTLNDTQFAALEMLADQVMMHLELRRQKNALELVVAERDQINATLMHQAMHLEEAQRIAETGSWSLDIPNDQLTWTHEIYRIFGVTRESLHESYDLFLSLVHPEDRQRVAQAFERTLQGKEALDIEHRIVRPDREERYVQERAELLGTETGKRILAGTVQDVTERHRSQELLNLLATSVSRINDIVMITEAEPIDEPGPRVVFVNESFKRETGYRREEILGKSPRMLQGPKTQRSELDRIRAALEKREPVSAELINYTKTGREFWLELEITPVMDATGRVTHFVSIQRNISERKQRLAELAQTNRALQMLTRCNEALLKAENEQELLEQICRLAVEIGGYQLAWVGYAQDDPNRTIKPMSYAGAHGQLTDLADVTISWSENLPIGHGPGGRTIRSGAVVVSEDVLKDPDFAPWRASAERHGYSGVVSLPLRSKDRTFGLLALHTSEVRPVTDEEIKLLQELADNLSFGINHLRARESQRRIESAMVKVAIGVSERTGAEFFELLARSMTEALGAQAGFVARFLPGEPITISTLSTVIDGKVADNFDYVIEGTPHECFLHETYCIVQHNPDEQSRYPCPLSILRFCIGKRFENSVGRPLGVLCALFRQPVKEPDFVRSILRIFSTRAASELERQEAYAHIRDQASLLDKAQDAIVVSDMDNRVSFWNKGAERLFGWTAEEALGKKKEDLVIEDLASFREAENALRKQGEWRGEIKKRRKDGRILTVECHWTLVKDDRGQPKSILAIDTDVTQRKAAEREIENLAFFDPLTRLPNRRLLLDRLQHALATSRRNGHSGALLFIDLDNFKILNDTLGHDKGDMLLQQVARRLETCARRSNTVARLGGDEFVVMLEDLSKNPWEAAAQAEIVGEKILCAFTQPFQLDGYEHHTTPSIGVTLFDNEIVSVDDLLKRADLAMYQAKAAGRNTIRFFDPEMQTVVSARVALEADLRNGLHRHEFFLQYQPQTDIDGHIKGLEALLRWQHTERGMVAPAAFIPLAEETGLITRLGQWVLEAVCTQMTAWAARPETSHLTVSVNVSARQFHHPDFVNQVLAVLHNTGANPYRLKLELTESLLIKNVEETVTKMNTLKAQGVGFSLDDFGTGYSSLSYLKRLPLDQLKIDQSFVKDVLIDSNDAAIARTIVALGQILGLEVLAEGVETEDQRDFLAQHGCNAYQGFLFGRPLAAEQI